MNAIPRQQANAPTPDEIAVCAYAIWEKEGRPQTRDVEHWLQAEAQLKIDRQQDSLRSIRDAIAASLAASKARPAPVFRRSTAKARNYSLLKMQAA